MFYGLNNEAKFGHVLGGTQENVVIPNYPKDISIGAVFRHCINMRHGWPYAAYGYGGFGPQSEVS